MPLDLDSAWQDSDSFSDMQADPVLPCPLTPQLNMKFDSDPTVHLEWAPSVPELHMLFEPDLPELHLSLESDAGIHLEWAVSAPGLHMLFEPDLPALHLSLDSDAAIHFEWPSHARPQIHLEPIAGFGFPQLHMQLEPSTTTEIYMRFEPSPRRLS